MVRVRVRFILFYSDLAPLTRDVTCSRFYLDGKSMRKKMSDKQPLVFNIEIASYEFQKL